MRARGRGVDSCSKEAKGEEKELREEKNQGPSPARVSFKRDKRKGCHGGLGEATTVADADEPGPLWGITDPDQRAERACEAVCPKIREARRLQASNRPRCAARLLGRARSLKMELHYSQPEPGPGPDPVPVRHS